MTKFIELHTHYHDPVFINVDAIAYMEEEYNGLRIFLRGQIISTHEKNGVVNKLDGNMKYIDVTESYAKVKSLIEE